MKKGIVNLVTAFFVVLLIFGGYFLYVRYSQNKNDTTTLNSDQTTNNLKEYKSDVLDFSILFPQEFQIEDKLIDVILKSNDGEIIISRQGTNYETLDEYWKDYLNRNKLSDVDETKHVINGLETVSTVIYSTKEIRFFKNGIVYTLSTESEPLFDDLDEVAQSFRYTP